MHLAPVTLKAGSFLVSAYAASSSASAVIRVSGTYLPPYLPNLPDASGLCMPVGRSVAAIAVVATMFLCLQGCEEQASDLKAE